MSVTRPVNRCSDDSTLVIRRGVPADAHAIAVIHVRSWQAAYKGIVPDAFLNSLSVDRRESVWQDNLERGASDVWVAEELGAVVGWISLSRSRDPDATPLTGEIWAIYVDPRHWRRGVGRVLSREAEVHLRTSGFNEVTLWVLEQNVQARAFYESIGFGVDPGHQKSIERGGAELIEIRLRRRLHG
jgi:ribosomal protein S18 acetylase RimI-like enzyme